MKVPIIKATIDTGEIERALELSNAVVDNLQTIKSLLAELREAAAAVDFKLGFTETQEET